MDADHLFTHGASNLVRRAVHRRWLLLRVHLLDTDLTWAVLIALGSSDPSIEEREQGPEVFEHHCLLVWQEQVMLVLEDCLFKLEYADLVVKNFNS